MNDDVHGNKPTKPSRRKLGIATAAAFGAGLLILVAFVLPAEFGVDPLRTGQLLGLTALSGSEQAITPQFEDHKTDYAEFVLEPFQSLEYKYLMDAGSALIYTWHADGELYYDMHTEHAAREDYEESFDSGTAAQLRGIYHAPFPGIAGWFWENRSFDTVTLRIHTAGFFAHSTVFTDRGEADREPPGVFD